MKITNNKPTFAFTGFQNVTSGGNMNRTINDSYLVLSAELNNNDSPDLDRFKKYLSKDNILTVSNKNVPSGRYKFLPEGTSIFEINGCPLEIDSEILNIFSHEELKQIEKKSFPLVQNLLDLLNRISMTTNTNQTANYVKSIDATAEYLSSVPPMSPEMKNEIKQKISQTSTQNKTKINKFVADNISKFLNEKMVRYFK
ncbi:TPA: hypothetical protein CPT82_03645 [Candidatus Gastranaerophilales bacterium HUM_2]|jgi:hypothetical protein|nr:MAG TPA: hypothetical protein CPT82_03645 [Candidatus Gastranaerophilales bacterium HUM_2]